MRGKPVFPCFAIICGRITPADAGKTSVICCSACVFRDHPRGCGENFFIMLSPHRPPGSPPRMRGKLHPTEGTLSAFRITPADAGKTRHWSSFSSKRKDHPRGCGENRLTCQAFSENIGSPPRMRGKLYRAAGIAEKYRITPADAGKTCCRSAMCYVK